MSGINIFSRWVCKTFYRLTHSEKYDHNKNLWPYFKVQRKPCGMIQNVYFKNSRLNHIDIEARARNKPLLIMASGPSVNRIRGEFYDDYFDYMGVNGACALTPINFRWYVIIDRSFIINKLDFIREIVGVSDLVLFCPCKCLEAICSLIPPSRIRCQFKIIETITNAMCETFLGKAYPVEPNDGEYHWFNETGFSAHLSRAVFDYGTVAYPALQIACALGYKHIYFAGLDMNSFHSPRFYEKADNILSTRLQRDFDKITRAFTAAHSYCDKHDINVVNLSTESAVTVFPRQSWETVIKRR